MNDLSVSHELQVVQLADYIADWAHCPVLVYVVQGAVVAENVAV